MDAGQSIYLESFIILAITDLCGCRVYTVVLRHERLILSSLDAAELTPGLPSPRSLSLSMELSTSTDTTSLRRLPDMATPIHVENAVLSLSEKQLKSQVFFS